MAGAGEEGIPVWGIDAGPDTIQAARVVRGADGELFLVDFAEAPSEGSGPDALVSFIRRRRLAKHPLVVAIHSASSRLGSVSLPMEQISTIAEEMRLACLEYIHPEPEYVDLRWTPANEDTQLICAEDRARVESYLVALETADVAAYGLVSSLDALLCGVRRAGVFQGDGVLLRVRPRWSDIILLDGDAVAHFGLPVGATELEEQAGREMVAADLAKIIEYHRVRVPREEAERILVLGLPAPAAEELSSLLPGDSVTTPEDPGNLKGRGKVSASRTRDLLLESPDAVGAAVAGASVPRRLQLAFRALPDELPQPPRPALSWFAAALIVWVALALAWFATSRDVASLGDGLAALERSRILEHSVEAETAERLQGLITEARFVEDFSHAVEGVFLTVPDETLAPYAAETITIHRALQGGYQV
ncbi:MAG: hypothetical protein ACYTDY_14715, partial [Planctomycetota bacterium]